MEPRTFVSESDKKNSACSLQLSNEETELQIVACGYPELQRAKRADNDFEARATEVPTKNSDREVRESANQQPREARAEITQPQQAISKRSFLPRDRRACAL